MNNNSNNQIIGYDPQTGHPIYMNQIKKKKFKWWIPLLFFVCGMVMILGSITAEMIIRSTGESLLDYEITQNPIIMIFRWLGWISWLSVIPSLIIVIVKYNKNTPIEKQANDLNFNNMINSSNSLDEKLLIAYIGNNYEKIIQQKFSVPALFLSWAYTLYRKTYLPTIIGMIAVIILGFLPLEIYYILILAFVIVLGICFNKWYVAYAKKQVNIIKVNNPNVNEIGLINMCKQKGGTNTWLAILIYVIFAMVSSSLNPNISKTNVEPPEEQKKFTKEEFVAIVNSYGDAATLALQQYLTITPNTLPTFEEIENNIVFDKHNVECEVSRVNYDYTVYLAGCKVDNFKLEENITYGQYLLEPEKTGDKVYVYLQSYPYIKTTTGEKINNTSYYMTAKEPANDGDNSNYLGLYECYDLNCKAYTVNPETNELLVYDGKYYLYDLDTNTKNIFAELDDKSDEIYKTISYITNGEKVYGLSIQGEKGTSFYNIEKQNFLTDFSYDYFQNVNVNALMEKGYIVGYKNYNTYLINSNTGEIYKTLEERMQFEAEKIGDTIVYYAVSSKPELATQYMPKYIYNANFEEIAISDNGFYNPVSNTNNTITIKDENGFKLYNFDGTLNYTSKQYKEIICIVRDYIVVLDEENNLKVLDLEEKELSTLFKVEDNYKLHPMISGYFTENGKNGIYIVVGDENIPYGTEGSGLEYYYIPSTGETGVIKTKGVGGYAKPVLYLYPETKTNITVDFDKEYLLTTTYPKFKNSWNITAYPNGDLYDKKGNYYYGLYWEEEGSTDVDFSEGFYVSKENAIKFLEDKLSIIGLNPKERNEFIMYWLPILEKNEHSLVYFELTEERELYNKLIINPKPDSLLRLAIHVKKVDSYTKIKEQKLHTFKRKGFVAVEWGGVVH